MRWPFKVVNSNGKPQVEVKYYGKTKQFTAEEISSMVTNAVVAVPACFNGSQRRATIDAGKIAGLNVMHIVSEPMAAALAYGLHKRIDSQRNVFIFDVSVISIGNEKFEAKAGGDDFDSRLVNYCVETFKQVYGGIDLTTNAKAISRLRKACETAKRTLSLHELTNIDVESLCGDIDFSLSISRCQFEQLCSDPFNRMLNIVNQTLSDAKLDKADVLLVGGSTPVLRVQYLLQNVFSRSKFIGLINPDEAATCDAAFLASNMVEKQSLQILKATPLSLNLALARGKLVNLIERSMKVPTKKTVTPITSPDNQRDMLIRVHGGGRALTNGNNLVDEFHLLGVPPSPREFTWVEVTFTIDENGVLNVSAVDILADKRIQVCIRDSGHLSEEQIELMINEAENRRIRNRESEMDDEEIRLKTLEKQRKNMRRMCKNTLKLMDFDQDTTKDTYELMRQKVESTYSSITAVVPNNMK
uniref:Heat shock protein 70 n=1 Tax=Taenia asiatica TaxID=60517 RepID=A0A0R3VZN8_TAEAS